MRRRVRDYIEISEYTPLDELITFLKMAQETLSEESEPILFIRGDHIFGQRLTIAFLRDLTEEEAACEARYARKPLQKRHAAKSRPEPLGNVVIKTDDLECNRLGLARQSRKPVAHAEV